MKAKTIQHQPIGKTGLQIPPIVFGTSSLGNLYEVVPDKAKLVSISEIFRCADPPVVLDSAGKYGAGLALEVIGHCLRKLNISPHDVIISNKLGWYRVPLRDQEPTFERGVWAGIQYDAEARISYDGILQCWEQGCDLLGGGYSPQMVSVHDPDEYLAGARGATDSQSRLKDVINAYRALLDLKAKGIVKAVGVGAKDWHTVRLIAERVPLDWVMFACSLTVYVHPPELLKFIAGLHERSVVMINSAVFHAGFLTGGMWFDYRKPDPRKETPLFAWRERFFSVCHQFNVKPADVCVQFARSVPGIVSVALNTAKPERIQDNVASLHAEIPMGLWRVLKDKGLIASDFPYVG